MTVKQRNKPAEPENYTNRKIELAEVKRNDANGMEFVDGWGFGPPPEALVLMPGDKVYVEQRGSEITGLKFAGRWLYHRSDEWLTAKWDAWSAKWEKEKVDNLARDRADWTARENSLSQVLKERLQRFRANGGEEFDKNGWGYELVTCELAELYVQSNLVETDEIKKYDEAQGCSGNQHGVAKMLARVLTEAPDFDMKQFPSALTPLTGDPFYKGKGIKEA